jgi:hypothetical protein
MTITANVSNVEDKIKKPVFRKIATALATEAAQRIIVGVIVFVAVPAIGTAIQNLLSKDEEDAAE